MAVILLLLATLFSLNSSLTAINQTTIEQLKDLEFSSTPDALPWACFLDIEESEEDEYELGNSNVRNRIYTSCFHPQSRPSSVLSKVFIHRNIVISNCCLKIPNLA